MANTTSFKAIEVGLGKCNANARRRLKALRILRKSPFLTRQCFTLPNHAPDVPRNFDIQIARDLDGNPIWAIWSWPCHATSYPQGNTINADFPGEVRRVLRQQLNQPDLPVVFLPGFSGDLRSDASPDPVPLWKRLMTPFARPFAETTLRNFDILCTALTDASKDAIAALSVKRLEPLSLRHNSVKMPLKHLMPDTTHQGVIGLSHLSFGPLNIFMIGAEMCSPWIEIVAPMLPPGAMSTGYCNDVPCYLPTDAQVLEGGYEVDGWRGSFGADGTFTTGLEEKILAAVQELFL